MYKAPTQFLDADATAGRVMAHARLLMKLSNRFDAVAPAGLRAAAQVANFKSGKVVILAENGAVAAKLRQMEQRLCRELSFGGAECSGIEVKVQPSQLPDRSMASTLKPLSGKTTDILRSTVESLPKGPLREALDNLLRRSASVEDGA